MINEQQQLITCLLCSPHRAPFTRGILFWKRQAERDIERSGIDYTIIRPGVAAAWYHSLRSQARIHTRARSLTHTMHAAAQEA